MQANVETLRSLSEPLHSCDHGPSTLNFFSLDTLWSSSEKLSSIDFTSLFALIEDSSCWRQFFRFRINCLQSYYHTNKFRNSYLPDIFPVTEDVDLHLLFNAFFTKRLLFVGFGHGIRETSVEVYEVAYLKLLILAVTSAWI